MAIASDNKFPKVIFVKGDKPATPVAGTVKVYAKTDGIYMLDESDVETKLSGGSSGSDVVSVSTPGFASGTLTLDFAGKSKYVGAITLTANVTTVVLSNLPGSGKYAEYELHITQSAAGALTFALPSSHKALGGSDTTIASGAGRVTVLSASTVNNGAAWRYAMQESAS